MAKYRVRDRDAVVDAFRMTEPLLSTPTAWPAWLTPPSLEQLWDELGFMPAGEYWIIRDGKGALSIQTTKIFPEFYTEVADG